MGKFYREYLIVFRYFHAKMTTAGVDDNIKLIIFRFACFNKVIATTETPKT